MKMFHRILATFLASHHRSSTSFDKDKTFHCMGLTPQTFYARMVPFDISSHASLIHITLEWYYKLYTAYLGNVVGGHGIRYINVPIDELRAAAVKTIDDDKPVGLGCDVGANDAAHRRLLDLLRL